MKPSPLQKAADSARALLTDLQEALAAAPQDSALAFLLLDMTDEAATIDSRLNHLVRNPETR